MLLRVSQLEPQYRFDKAIPYIISRKGGGFFSILSTVLCQIRIAERLGLTPVVDFENYASTYSEEHLVYGVRNSWEYYFLPVSALSANQALNSPLAIESGGDHPKDAPEYMSSDPDLLRIWKQYVALNGPMSDFDNHRDGLVGEGTLGIHFRGNELRSAKKHPLPMTLNQALSVSKRMFDTHNLDTVYLVTEGLQYISKFRKTFGKRLLVDPTYRIRYGNAYGTYPRHNHKFLLGKEALLSALTLSRCGGLVASDSNLSDFSIMVNESRYRAVVLIKNGTNSANKHFASVMWYLKALLPLGSRYGLKNHHHDFTSWPRKENVPPNSI